MMEIIDVSLRKHAVIDELFRIIISILLIIKLSITIKVN